MRQLLVAFTLTLLFSTCTLDEVGPNGNGTPPPEFYLKQNYPNPFTDTTTVEFGFPSGASSSVSVIVYDGMLNPIRTLYSKTAVPGNYSTKWDGKNAQGIQMPAGSYIIELKGSVPQTTILDIQAVKK